MTSVSIQMDIMLASISMKLLASLFFIATCTLSPDTRAMCPIQKAGLGALYQVNRNIRISVVLGFATKMEHNNGAIHTKIKIIEL